MSVSLPAPRCADLLQSLERPHCAKAKLDLNQVEKAAALLRAAIRRSGHLEKVCGNDAGQLSRKLDGKEKLWFHEMVATWPPDVWCELLVVLANTVCAGHFSVERSVVIREIAK